MMINFTKPKENNFFNRRENCVSKPSGSRGFEVACSFDFLLLVLFLLFNRSFVMFVGFVPDEVGTTTLFIAGDAMHDAMHDSVQFYMESILPLYLDFGESAEPTVKVLLLVHLVIVATAWVYCTVFMFFVNLLLVAGFRKWQEVEQRRRLLLMLFDAAEREAMVYYTGNGYKAMNRQLRAGTVSSAKMKATITAMETAISKLKVYSGTVYRGTPLPDDIRKTLKRGAVFTDQAFMSSTRNVCMAFLKKPTDVLFEIECKSGVEIHEYSQYPAEEEVLFRPGTRFKIKRVVKRGRCRVFMEEIE